MANAPGTEQTWLLLVGGVVTEPVTEGAVELLLAPGLVRILPKVYGPVLNYLQTPRRLGEAIAAGERGGWDAEDLRNLESAGLIVSMAPRDVAAVADRLDMLVLAPLEGTRVAAGPSSPSLVALALPEGGYLPVSRVTGAVLADSNLRPLGAAVAEAADALSTSEPLAWSRLADDLVRVLGNGAAVLLRADGGGQ